MPRPKVIERRRCVKACDGCKKRKDKCDGLVPCSPCRKRNIEHNCFYSVSRSTNTKSQSPQNRHTRLREDMVLDSNAAIAMGTIAGVEHREPSENGAETAAPVPKLSRLLRDPKGKFIYIGDSASLSFLQTIRRIVNSSIGPCSFNTDSMRHKLIETAPLFQGASFSHSDLNLDSEEVYDLTKWHFLAVSGALDLFEASEFQEKISMWLQDPLRHQRLDCPLFYLVLAIGAQARLKDEQDDYAAEYYFSYARHLAITNLMDDPSILTVQVFAMIAWYMVTACRRNGALMNLGIAIQAAYALGIHRHEANIAFGKDEVTCRERAWKSLRVCDLFLSSSIGRPSSTSNIDYSNPGKSSQASNYRKESESLDRVSSAIARICLIFERILSEVYSKRAVSLELAASISKQHREWTNELPEMLKIDGLAKSNNYDAADLTRYLGSAIVVMAYYYSIILLTRPFLTFRVSSHVRAEAEWREWQEKARTSPGVTTYADACVNSAIQGVALAHDVIFRAGMPKRMPLVINSVFISALSIGLAFFGDYDRHGWPLEKTITQAIAVLRHFGVHNPQSARYQQITESLLSAANQYKSQRNNNMMHFKSQHVSDVFGYVSSKLEPEGLTRPRLSERSSSLAIPRSPNSERSRLETEDDAAGLYFSTLKSLESIAESSMITTSGMLASDSVTDESAQYWPLNGDYVGDADPSMFFGNSSPLSSTNNSFGDDVPLFAITNVYHAEI